MSQSRNPFVWLEALQEQLGSLGVALGGGYDSRPVPRQSEDYRLGTPEYHLTAAEAHARRLFQVLADQLPAEYAEYDQPAS